jgi:glycosyltransferase involved in cell wall biosynthesis
VNYLSAVDTFFPDRPSGSARVAWDIANILRDQGHAITFLSRKQSESDEEFSVVDGMSVIRFLFPKTAPLDPFKLQKQKKEGHKVAREYLGSTQWDVVHIHSPLQGAVAREILGEAPRYLYTIHSPAVLEQKVKWAHQGLPGRIKSLIGGGLLKSFEGPLLRRADRIHTLSDYTRRTMEQYYPISAKTSVIPHWSDGFKRNQTKTDARNELCWPKAGRIILTVRRIAPRMGLEIALSALAGLLKSHDDLSFVIVGSGPLETKLKALVETLGLSEKVRFLGRVDESVLRSCYEAADLFLLPTTDLECFGLILLEALSFGLPIIATDAGAIPEIMQPILPNFIVRAGNVDDLRTKVDAWRDGRLPVPNSDRLVQYVQKDFSRETIIPRLLSFICE